MSGICERSALKSGASLAAVSICLAFAGGAMAGGLPTGGQIVNGKGKISEAGASLTVKQSSTTGIIDWKSFSIGKADGITFNNGTGATLNRVTGGNLSTIAGSLHATGSLYLMNSAGVIVSGTGKVATGGSFVASSGNTPNSTFDPTKTLLITHANGIVVNRGSITSSHGDVMLVGNMVRNRDTLLARNGTAGLAAGTSAAIAPSGDQRVQVLAGTGDATNSGAIDADSAELRAANGNVYALAGNKGGIINATGTSTQGGHIWLTSQSGTTRVNSTLSARNGGGTGGTIETSGGTLYLNHATIDAGHGGQWTVDPKNLTVTTSAAKTIDKSLNKGTNVTLKTTATGATGSGSTSSGPGDIIVNAKLSWKSTATLTLDAYHSVTIDDAIAVTGKGGLAITTGKSGDLSFDDGGAVTFANLASRLTINGATYTLVNNIATLARDVAKADDGNYALANNYNAKADGTYKSSPIGELTGTFEGLGNSISGLTIKDTTQNAYVGLFEAIGFSGTVRDIALTNLSVTGGANQTIGGLVSLLLGTIEQSSASGTIKGGDGSSIGGMVGELLNGNIFDSSSAGPVIATTSGKAGGLVGFAQGGVVAGSSSSAALSSADDAAALEYSDNLGGLVGYDVDGTVSNSQASGTITTGAYDNGSSLGGLVGLLQTATVSDSSASTAISAQTNDMNNSGFGYQGGLVGYMTGSTVTGSHASGTVSGALASTGGLVGDDENGSIISKSYARGDVACAFNCGGLIGAESGGTITNSYATGNITTLGGSGGGLIGFGDGDTLTGTYATGTVTGSGDYEDTGGLMGEAYKTNITASFATGAVTNGGGEGSYVGGLVGEGEDITIDQTYATGKIAPGGATVGGLLGGATGSTITNSYWDTTTTGINDTTDGAGSEASEPGITAITDKALKAKLPAGFSKTYWAQNKTIKGGLPYLSALKSSY